MVSKRSKDLGPTCPQHPGWNGGSQNQGKMDESACKFWQRSLRPSLVQVRDILPSEKSCQVGY